MSTEQLQSVAPTIASLLPTKDAAEDAYLPAFRAVAGVLLNRATLVIAERPHRLTELEFYFNGLGHEDPFTHNDPLQKSFGYWYFHRHHGQYKAGTYKGLDIAIGSDEAFGGILVRGAHPLGNPGVILDGPCTFVDHILSLTGSSSVAALAESFDRSIDPPPSGADSPLFIALSSEGAPGQDLRVFESARVGLTLKKGPTEGRQRFLAKPYRFMIEPKQIRKGRTYLVLALHRQGESEGEIAALTGVSRVHISRYVSAYEDGKAKSPEAFTGDLSNEDLCALLGACDQRA